MTPRQRLMCAIKGRPDLIDRLLVVASPSASYDTIKSSGEAYKACAHLVAGFCEERFGVVAFNRRQHDIGSTVVTVGNDSFTVVCPRQIFRWALLQGRSGAHAIVVCHNHPTGDPTPSSQDVDVTHRLVSAGRVLGIKVLDHIVVGDGGRFYSFAEHGRL